MTHKQFLTLKKKKVTFHGTIVGEKVTLQSFLHLPTSEDLPKNEIIGKVQSEGTIEFTKPIWFDDNSEEDYEKFWIRRDDLNRDCESFSDS